ncbi:MAG: hypothetical protein EP330_06480 [Deltaproteobacteria bacterium]|nr:MAG: hypothetical protein EP330_06480 [Deltaproteobacteria bacterium]
MSLRFLPLCLLVGCGTAETVEDPLANGSPGCTATASLEEGEQTLLVDGLEREFIVRLPDGYSTERAWPLVFALHPNETGAWYWDMEDAPHSVRGPFEDDAILVLPNAIDGNWRDYNADESTWPARMDQEFAFLDALHVTATEQLCVDETRTFAMGFSGGGSFAFALGCTRDWVRAIATGGAVLYIDPAECTHAPAGWVTIGQEEMGAGRLALRDEIAAQAGCEPIAEEPVVDAEPVCVEATGCAQGTPMTYCSHPDGHLWPAFGSEAVRGFFAELD